MNYYIQILCYFFFRYSIRPNRPLTFNELLEEIEHIDHIPDDTFWCHLAARVVTIPTCIHRKRTTLFHVTCFEVTWGLKLRNFLEMTKETVMKIFLNNLTPKMICLSLLTEQKRKTTPRGSQSKKFKITFVWSHGDLQSNFPPWQHVVGCKNQMAPVEYFQVFFDDEVVQMLVDFSNKYATQKNETEI